MSYLLIANIFSGITACFTVSSAWIADKRKSFILQIFQCLFYAIASFFFGAYASITTTVLCAARCWLLANDRFDLKACVIYVVLVLGIGTATNNIGLAGFLPIIATVQSGVCNFVFKSLIGTKWTIFVNMALWVVYEIFVLDFASLIVDSSTLVVSIAAIIRISRMQKSGSAARTSKAE